MGYHRAVCEPNAPGTACPPPAHGSRWLVEGHIITSSKRGDTSHTLQGSSLRRALQWGWLGAAVRACLALGADPPLRSRIGGGEADPALCTNLSCVWFLGGVGFFF